jgi:isopenicillin-N epimerase
MAVWVQQLLCDRWQVEPASPRDGSLLGSMVTVRLPAQDRLKATFASNEVLNLALYEKHRIEVPVVDWDGSWWVRPCCQVYNTSEQYERLAAAVIKEIDD